VVWISVFRDEETDSQQTVNEVSEESGQQLSDDDPTEVVQKIRTFLHEEFGIHFPKQKLFLLNSKLKKRKRMVGSDSLKDYYNLMQNNDQEIPKLLDLISTNKTNFFRETNHWTFLRNDILPSVNDKTYKIWSSACSSGEEAYTASIVMEESLDVITPNHYKVLGTDISHDVISRAIKGYYTASDVKPIREISPNYIQKYFHKEETAYQVKQNIRARNKFRKFNLRADNYPFHNTFDVIFCRNVLIYFDNSMIKHVISELTNCLKPDGYLMIGHTENLNNINHQLRKVKPAIFQKIR